VVNNALSWRTLGAYAALALPLAMALLPVYVHTPKLYADNLGVPLAVVGMVLFGTRLFNAVLDPLLGWWSDRVASKGGSRHIFIVAAIPLLALGVLGLFHPIKADMTLITVWLFVCLKLTYAGFSMGAISYFSIGAELSEDYHERTRVTAVRGAIGVVGILIAAALPELLASGGPPGDGLRLFSLLFVPVLLLAAALTVFGAPQPRQQTAAKPESIARKSGVDFFTSLFAALKNTRFRWLLRCL
jgi:glycoside/pentoside/hexuronide:cation symporter, GPH family